MNPNHPNPQPPLFPGEHILWEGRPYTGVILEPYDWVTIPFSLLWAGGVVYSALTPEIFWSSFPFLIMAFTAIAVFPVDTIQRRRLRYFVTDRRILILHGKRRTVSLDLKSLLACEFEERADGSGTLRFGSSTITGRFVNTPRGYPAPQFLRIADVRNVYTLIYEQSARLESAQPTA